MIRRRRDEREKRVRKGGRTEEKKLVFNIGETVRLQCPKSKRWDIRGEIKALRYSETGQIVSYDVLLPNGKLTSRHRRFMTRDIPDNVKTQLGDDGGIPGGPNDEGSVATSAHGEGIHGAPENEGSVTSGHSREGVGVVTRSRRFIGKLANSAHGKLPGGADLVTKREVESQVSLHSSG